MLLENVIHFTTVNNKEMNYLFKNELCINFYITLNIKESSWFFKHQISRSNQYFILKVAWY